MYDLAWIGAHHHEIGGIDRELVRRLAVLKVWVDANGLSVGIAVWKPGHESTPFDPDRLLRERDANSSTSATSVPSRPRLHPPAELSDALRNGYGFFADLDEDERALAAARGQDAARPQAAGTTSRRAAGRGAAL